MENNIKNQEQESRQGRLNFIPKHIFHHIQFHFSLFLKMKDIVGIYIFRCHALLLRHDLVLDAEHPARRTDGDRRCEW
ncbi:MAG: hypothetical protein GWP06_11030 [Actinobacteria bacterium]|nr:hypothetical protein [Actinomycetota bacterium]